VAAAAAAGKEEEVGLVLQRRGRHVASSHRRGVPCYVCTRNWLSLELFPEFARRRGEHDGESVWLAWHVGHSAVEPGPTRCYAARCQARTRGCCLQASAKRGHDQRATMKQANRIVFPLRRLCFLDLKANDIAGILVQIFGNMIYKTCSNDCQTGYLFVPHY